MRIHHPAHRRTQELQLYLDRVSQLLRAGGRLRDVLASGAEEQAYQKAVLASLATDPGTEKLSRWTQPTICAHVIDERPMPSSCLSSHPDSVRGIGLHPLAPYLTQLIAAETATRLGSLPHLALLLGTAEALLRNPGIDMEPYVHQLLPAVVTCLVARRLGVRNHPSACTRSFHG